MNKLIIKGFMVLGIGTVFSGCIDNVVAPEPTTYTKLDTQGLALTDQTVGWSEDASASEANYNRWSCVQDDTSTLIWEIKTSYAGNALQAANDMFTWYNTDAASNGGEAGIGDLGNNVATSYENGPYTALEPATQIGSDYCYDSGRCDTKKYIEDINAFGLCGLSDWRMPTQDELANLIYGTYKSNGGGVLNHTFFFSLRKRPKVFQRASRAYIS